LPLISLTYTTVDRLPAGHEELKCILRTSASVAPLIESLQWSSDSCYSRRTRNTMAATHRTKKKCFPFSRSPKTSVSVSLMSG